MTKQTTTATRTVHKGYYCVDIQAASGGFGEYQANIERADEFFEDPSHLILSFEPHEHVSTEDADWADHEDSELVEGINNVSGKTYNEPEILVAMRDDHGTVTVFGIDAVDCYEQKGGEYVPVDLYDEDPESYTLA